MSFVVFGPDVVVVSFAVLDDEEMFDDVDMGFFVVVVEGITALIGTEMCLGTF